MPAEQTAAEIIESYKKTPEYAVSKGAAPTPEAITAFKARAKAAGLSDEIIDAHVAATTVKAPAKPGDAPGPGHNQGPSVTTGHAITPAQEAAAIAALDANWVGPRDELDAVAARIEGKAPAVDPNKPADTRSVEARQYDALPLAGPKADLQAMRLNGRTEVDPADFAATYGLLRSAVANMPAIFAGDIAAALLDGGDEAEANYGPASVTPDPIRFKQWTDGQDALLKTQSEHIGGPALAVSYALHAIDHLPKAARQTMIDMGLLASANAIMALAAQGKRQIDREAQRLKVKG